MSDKKIIWQQTSYIRRLTLDIRQQTSDVFYMNWKQCTARKAVEDALQYIKMYLAGVWAKTAKGYFKNVEKQSIRHQNKVWSNLYCFLN